MGPAFQHAVYSGDANNKSATSACLDEHLVIGKNGPSIVTLLSATSAAIGAPVHDSATLSGATSDAGGTATYTVYRNNTCTDSPRDAGTVTVSGGGVPNSNALQFDHAGKLLLAGRLQRRRQQRACHEPVQLRGQRASRDPEEQPVDRDETLGGRDRGRHLRATTRRR